MRSGYENLVRVWLITGAFLVIAMVVIGGITRLTHSGLSMVDWKPITGAIPPLNAEDWSTEFENYKQFPEFQKLNYDFTLSDFKSIFWWEFIHRFLGRVIGVVFAIPFIFFLLKKVFDKKWKVRLLILFFLGGMQGVIGWFMVKSGLVDNPAVSHYRLAIHFASALTVYSYIIWLLLDISNLKGQTFSKMQKRWSWLLFISTGVQIVYGAFVAGLKAGLIHTKWPSMGDGFISPLIGNALSTNGITALVENPSTVQFIHRMIPYLILFAILMLIRSSPVKTRINYIAKVILGIWVLQFVLGISTLLLQVPVVLGVMHQLVGVVLLTSLVFLFKVGFSRSPA